jgi:hypothetical protein
MLFRVGLKLSQRTETIKMMRRAFGLVFALVVIVKPAYAAEVGQLPLGLQYFISVGEAKSHFKMMKDDQVQTGERNQLAFIVSDPVSKTKTGMFLKFNSRGLVEVTSGRYEMTQRQFKDYMPQMMAKIKEMKKTGIQTVVESPENNLYIYKDAIQYVTIGVSLNNRGHQVELSFTEKAYQDRK